MSANFNRYGIAAEQDLQDLLRLVSEMQKAKQVAEQERPIWRRTSYLAIAKLASLRTFRVRRFVHEPIASR